MTLSAWTVHPANVTGVVPSSEKVFIFTWLFEGEKLAFSRQNAALPGQSRDRAGPLSAEYPFKHCDQLV
jgi:hypothetical protein